MEDIERILAEKPKAVEIAPADAFIVAYCSTAVSGQRVTYNWLIKSPLRSIEDAPKGGAVKCNDQKVNRGLGVRGERIDLTYLTCAEVVGDDDGKMEKNIEALLVSTLTLPGKGLLIHFRTPEEYGRFMQVSIIVEFCANSNALRMIFDGTESSFSNRTSVVVAVQGGRELQRSAFYSPGECAAQEIRPDLGGSFAPSQP